MKDDSGEEGWVMTESADECCVVDTPDTGSGTGSSGAQREEQLKGSVPGMNEREKVEQGKT